MSENFDFSDMSEEELRKIVADSHKRYTTCLDEISKRQQKERDAIRQKLCESGKVKKLKAAYKAALKACQDAAKSQTITLTVPVKFKLDSTCDINLEYLENIHDNFYNSVTGTIDNKSDLNKKQRAVLQTGLTMVVSNACNQIMGLFPGFTKKQEIALKQLQKVVKSIHDVGLTCEDLEQMLIID